MKKTAILILFLLFTFMTFSQPHIKGTVKVNLENGLIQCDFTLSNLPKLGDYKVLLNRGMNIKFFKDLNGNLLSYDGFYDGETLGEGLGYYFVNEDDKQADLPKEFKIEYTSAFPVYKDSFNSFDYKGFIAVNGKTFRATEQSKWYPVLYDVDNDKLIDGYTYDLTVITEKSQSTFVNGSAPQKGLKTSFSSKKAVPLFLFTGDYDYINVDGDYLINTDVSNVVATDIFNNIDSIKAYYASLLGIEFTDNIYIISHDAVKDMKNSEWGFNAYPSFGFANLDFNSLMTEERKFRANRYHFFAHELAHNYFGNNVNSGNLSWFWLEGAAEYLALVALEDYSDKKNVDGYYNFYLGLIADKDFIPLCDITESKQIGDVYRYRLGPLMFKTFQISFGKEKTMKTIKSLLELSKTQALTIDSWEASAIKAGISKNDFAKFKSTYLCGNEFKQNITDLVKSTFE